MSSSSRDLADTPAAYCAYCGERLDAQDHEACAGAVGDGRPHFCDLCRRPLSVDAAGAPRCLRHGIRVAAAGGPT